MDWKIAFEESRRLPVTQADGRRARAWQVMLCDHEFGPWYPILVCTIVGSRVSDKRDCDKCASYELRDTPEDSHSS